MSRQAEMMRGPVAATIDDVVEAVDRRFKAAYERAHVAAKQRALAAVPKATEMVIKKRRAAVEPTTPRPIKKTGKKDRAYFEDRLAQLLAGQDELRRGQVAVAQHVTRERVATAKAMEAVRKHEAEPPEIFLSHVVLTAEQIDLPVDELEPIPDEYDGDIQVYIRDSVVNKVIVGGPYPLRVPRGGWCREALKRAIKCTMDTCSRW
ncbi:hypothetical protein SDRG_10453 [Saprolegnia diclina VS20]|uniref:Uncharacterized protein n=1 Tax=Saprolegnia diclina (strain VS20) TaxID=1156394 RepID=T0RPA6_SAPDV|nr:hypothetical protein SDRG_10453 [Saprolegnia diclina VS20]EQC31937.1 hypothetical protein SDRG_10453 [Saprolegnia diclina VS20]|eukprot:XP_008614665.1 hypothetical protein SDRG_10453 [Saprolegnia diclina VS20]